MTVSARPPRKTALRLNIALLRFTRHWAAIIVTVLGLYSTLPFAAPILMHLGATTPARILYTLYSPFCHQFAFRSVFLFGEQPFYPRAVSGETAYRPYEAYIEGSPEFRAAVAAILSANNYPPEAIDNFDPNNFTALLQFASRDFLGDARMGYKTALCMRDVAIYLAMFVGGLIYLYPPVRRRLQPPPLWLYALVGLGPLGLDGVSQLLSYPPFNFWEPRETTPFFRISTGVYFGLMNIWIGLPYLELSMRDARKRIEAKLANAGIYI